MAEFWLAGGVLVLVDFWRLLMGVNDDDFHSFHNNNTAIDFRFQFLVGCFFVCVVEGMLWLITRTIRLSRFVFLVLFSVCS